MRGVGRGILEFVVGDDIWIAVTVAGLLVGSAVLARTVGDAWEILAVGVPAALWLSLRRARRRDDPS